MPKISNSIRNKSKTDWDHLWSNAKTMLSAAGMDRQKAVFDNFSSQKEEICRTMGIISMADVSRIQRRMEAASKDGQ